jgi:hypothetical protein
MNTVLHRVYCGLESIASGLRNVSHMIGNASEHVDRFIDQLATKTGHDVVEIYLRHQG